MRGVDAQRPLPNLDGKLHVHVGTADEFYLDQSARLLQDALDAVGARSEFRFVEGRTHFDLFVEGDDRMATTAWR